MAVTLARRKSIGIGRTLRVMTETFLPEIENVQPAIRGAHPKQAGPIAVERNHAVVAEAVRIGVVVLEVTHHAFCAPIEVIEP